MPAAYASLFAFFQQFPGPEAPKTRLDSGCSFTSQLLPLSYQESANSCLNFRRRPFLQRFLCLVAFLRSRDPPLPGRTTIRRRFRVLFQLLHSLSYTITPEIGLNLRRSQARFRHVLVGILYHDGSTDTKLDVPEMFIHDSVSFHETETPSHSYRSIMTSIFFGCTSLYVKRQGHLVRKLWMQFRRRELSTCFERCSKYSMLERRP